MSIAPIPGLPNFGVTPGFGINPIYGVSATPPRTSVDLDGATQSGQTFGQMLAEQIAATGAATTGGPTGVAAASNAQSAFGVPAVGEAPTAQFNPSFGSSVADRLTELNALHKRSDQLAVKAVTGDLQDIHEYTIAANESGVATQLAVSVRDKAVAAFNDVIRMQL